MRPKRVQLEPPVRCFFLASVTGGGPVNLVSLRIIVTNHTSLLIGWVFTYHLSCDPGGPAPAQNTAVPALFLTHPQILWYDRSTETGAGDDR